MKIIDTFTVVHPATHEVTIYADGTLVCKVKGSVWATERIWNPTHTRAAAWALGTFDPMLRADYVPTSSPVTHTGGSDISEIRAWARSQGMDVGERGRLHSSVRDAYEAARVQSPTTERAS